MNQELRAGCKVFHEDDSGHLVSMSGEYLAVIKHKSVTFKWLGCDVKNGRMHVAAYYTFLVNMPDEPETVEVDKTEPEPETEKKSGRARKNEPERE